MKRIALLAAAMVASSSASAFAVSYPQDGIIGVFGDAAGTNCCITLPPAGASTLHVIAITGGASSSGFTGAEFRIEVSPPAPGAFFGWQSNPAANVTLGTPIDNSSALNDNSGMNIAFPSCQKQLGMAGDHVSLGTITVFGLSGEHQLYIKQHNRPSNPNNRAPLLVLCDAPEFTAVALTLKDGDPALFGQEAYVFRTSIDSPSCSGTCGFVSVAEKTWSGMKGLYR
jgi:hypothetical protein